MSAQELDRHPFRRSSNHQSTGGNENSSTYKEYSHFETMSSSDREFKDPNGAPLARTDTIGSISLTPEQFERMYLGPQNKVKGDLRLTFGNPTPVGLAGLLLALTPIAVQFLGWRGTQGGEGIPTTGFSFFIGGVIPVLAAVGEFILGNSFPALFLAVFGGFFMSYAATLIPWFNAYIPYSSDPTDRSKWLDGAATPTFAGSIGIIALFMGVFSTMLLVATLRTNVIFVMAFTALSLAFFFLTVSRFYLVKEDLSNYLYYEKNAGYAGFVLCMLGWYLLFVEILTTVDFPFIPPVFDLSAYVPSGTDLAKRKRAKKGEADSEA